MPQRSFAFVCLALGCFELALGFPPSHDEHDHGHDQGHGSEPAGHEWAAPGPFDSRSPCPGLNALANHGWLPRNGLNISYEQIQYAALHGYNFDPDTYLVAFLAANETFKLSTTGSSLTIHLRDLARHKTIEQDGSQSRNDIYFGDNLHYDETVFAPVAANLGLDAYGPKDAYVTIETAAKARAARQAEARRVNPTFSPGPGPLVASIATTGLYLATLWDFDAKAAPKAWVKAFFEEDRIAYKEGYKAPKVKDGDFVGSLVAAVTNASSDAGTLAMKMDSHGDLL